MWKYATKKKKKKKSGCRSTQREPKKTTKCLCFHLWCGICAFDCIQGLCKWNQIINTASQPFFFKSKTVKKTKQKWWLHIFKHMHFSDFATWLWRQRPLQFSIRPFHSWADEPVWRLQVFTCIDSSTTVSTLGQSWACPQPGHNMPLDSDCKWNSSC